MNQIRHKLDGKLTESKERHLSWTLAEKGKN